MKVERKTIERELQELGAAAIRLPGGVTLFADEGKLLMQAARAIEELRRASVAAREGAKPTSGD